MLSSSSDAAKKASSSSTLMTSVKKSIKKQRLGGGRRRRRRAWRKGGQKEERRKSEEDEEEESEEDETGVFDPLGKPRIQERAFDDVWKKDTRPFVTERITDFEEEEEEDEEKKRKKREAEAEESPDVFIAYEKHATKSQQHRERLKRQAEASANAYRPGLRNRGEDALPITAAKVKAMTFREAEWLKMNPVPTTVYTGKRSKDGHRRPAVILESIISKDYKRIKTESRFKRLTRLIEGINVARWGFEGIEDKEEVRITKEFYDLTQYYETKKSKREKKKRMKALARKKRREEKRRDFVPKTIVARRLAPVVNFRKPKVRAHPIRFLKSKSKEEEEEEERETLLAIDKDEEKEDDEPEVVQMQVQPSSSSYSFMDVLDTIHDWVGSNLANLRETCQNANARKQEYILDKIEKISTMHMPKAVSEQKDIYRDFLRSLDASVVPAHGTIKMYQNLFAEAKSQVQNLVSATKIQDEWFLITNSPPRPSKRSRQNTNSPERVEDDDEACIIRTCLLYTSPSPRD